MATTKACSEELWLENDSAVLTQLTSLVSTNLPQTSRASVDVTNQASANEDLDPSCLRQLGTLTATFNGEIGAADYTLLDEMDAAGAVRTGKIVTGNPGSRKEVPISVWIANFNRGDEAAPGEARNFTVEFQPKTAPTIADPA